MNSTNGKDQAETLRKAQNSSSRSDNTSTRVISFTSGKGGVGKTSIVTNLAYILNRLGKKVFVLDADIGLANVDVILGLTPKYNIQHVLMGEKSLSDIIVEGPGGIKIFPASSGVQELSELTYEQKLNILEDFDSLEETIDFLLVDTGAGISSNVMYFNLAAQEKVVVVTPEPTSVTDAYAIMKVMAKKHSETRFKLIANEVKDENEASELFNSLNNVAERFLNISLEYLGFIVRDNNVNLSIKKQQLTSILYPDCKFSMCILKIAKKIMNTPPVSTPGGNIGFFWNRLLDKTESNSTG